MIKSVESEEEFNAILPQLILALQSNSEEWSYYHSIEDMLEMMNGNKHMLFYEGSLYGAAVFGFFIVERYRNGNAQIDLMWSWAKNDIYVDGLAEAAHSLAMANGARRIRVNACRRLARKLLKHGYKVRCMEMVKEV